MSSISPDAQDPQNVKDVVEGLAGLNLVDQSTLDVIAPFLQQVEASGHNPWHIGLVLVVLVFLTYYSARTTQGKAARQTRRSHFQSCVETLFGLVSFVVLCFHKKEGTKVVSLPPQSNSGVVHFVVLMCWICLVYSGLCGAINGDIFNMALPGAGPQLGAGRHDDEDRPPIWPELRNSRRVLMSFVGFQRMSPWNLTAALLLDADEVLVSFKLNCRFVRWFELLASALSLICVIGSGGFSFERLAEVFMQKEGIQQEGIQHGGILTLAVWNLVQTWGEGYLAAGVGRSSDVEIALRSVVEVE